MTPKEAFEILRDTPIDIRSAREDDIHSLYATAQNMALDALQKQMWIPCSERLPEDTRTKLITLDGITEAGYYSEGNWWCIGDSINLEVKTKDVIAWMPLPEPYKLDQTAWRNTTPDYSKWYNTTTAKGDVE